MAVDITDRQFIATLKEKERRQQRQGGRWIVLPIIVLTIAYLTPLYYLFVTVFKTSEEYARKSVLALPDSLAPLLHSVQHSCPVSTSLPKKPNLTKHCATQIW